MPRALRGSALHAVGAGEQLTAHPGPPMISAMETLELFQRLSVALAIGLVIGLERGWHTRGEREGERAAGLRTHALAGVLGGVWGAIAHGTGDGGVIALALVFSVFSGIVAFYRFREISHDGTFGVTTVVAAMLAFALGALAVVGNMQAAAAAGVTVAGLLALKTLLHTWVRRLSWVELRSALVLLAMTFVALPMLPNRTIDPWDAINPFALWLMTILIALLSFAGYVAIKVMGGRRGVVLTGLAGGLVSSTAVTLNLARLARDNPQEGGALVAGALFASAMMMARVLIVVGILSARLFALLGVPIGLAGLVLAGAGFAMLKSSGGGEERHGSGDAIEVKNPFEIVTVLSFGALLTVITVLAKVVTHVAGDVGAYVLAAISGIADVDAITLSMARLTPGAIRLDVAAWAIVIAVAVNTASKTAMGWLAGGRAFGVRMAAAGGLAIVVALGAIALVGRALA